MRKALLLCAALLLCLPGMSDAQSCDGCGIGYRPAGGAAGLTSSGTAITSTLPILLPDGSSVAPSLAASGAPNTGIYYHSPSASIRVSANGTDFLTVRSSAPYVRIRDSVGLGTDGLTADVILTRDAANTLTLRNGTAAQQLNVYNSFTTYGSNYGMFSIVASATGTDLVGTGAGATASTGGLRSIQGSKSKTLTDNTATAFVRLAVADDDYEGCAIGWTAVAEDANGDARQIRKGRTNVAVLNNSGTEACNFSASADDQAILVTAGTFVCSFDCNSAVADTVDLRATCDTSLDAAAEILTFEYRLDCESTVTVTPQ